MCAAESTAPSETMLTVESVTAECTVVLVCNWFNGFLSHWANRGATGCRVCNSLCLQLIHKLPRQRSFALSQRLQTSVSPTESMALLATELTVEPMAAESAIVYVGNWVNSSIISCANGGVINCRVHKSLCLQLSQRLPEQLIYGWSQWM